SFDVGLRDVQAHELVDLVAYPSPQELSLTAIGVDFELTDAGPDRSATFNISVQDPLNPRLALHCADYTVTGTGRVRIVCDFPDQVVPAGRELPVALRFDRAVKRKNLKLEQYRIPKERAILEALEHRKFILHALYVPICEARPWNGWNDPRDDDKYFKAPPT